MSESNAGHANLIPAAPGEVRNPKGINQYTYRDDAKREFAKLAKENADAFLDKVFELAKSGESWAAKLVWEEILPAVKALDVRFSDGAPAAKVPATDERLSAVAEIVQETLH